MVALNGASVCSPDLERKKVAVAVGRGKFNSLKFKVQSLMLIRGKATALK
jgi:hypothetical protein